MRINMGEKKSLNAVWLSGLTVALPMFMFTNMGWAEENPAPNTGTEIKQTTDNSVLELGAVTVTAKPTGNLDSRDILSSVDIMNYDKIADQNVLTSFDLLHRMPGVQITQFNQGITTGKFSFRAFNSEGNINVVKLLIDGIPSNTNDGNMPFIDALFPLDIESIETVRGTNDPRNGLHAIAGNANIRTFEGGNYAKGRVRYGSFDTVSVQSGAGYEKTALPRITQPITATPTATAPMRNPIKTVFPASGSIHRKTVNIKSA